MGYTEYYLTHKFKEETGLSVTDYIKFAKIERAKVLLKSTDQTVQDIAAALSFSTRNYFSRIFRRSQAKPRWSTAKSKCLSKKPSARQTSSLAEFFMFYSCVSARAILTTREALIFTCSSVTAPLAMPCSRLS